ncbi:undecaprenyl-phosphate glucose phosphotransferase [Pontibacter cellulosilyticus]|uniref:Undecaprenyl-phosphate glucose phosphotransferase n=1 Tax=Pontibacter cellulosilyticus TaxID=1720253 RepID=A0A923N5A6_9BACT|nr:undecaprenyl-phosphate glucose phosphotransferase [Pontibacter cellulosilyticus]MBC5992114.1 undecaprenyl-phosphate glucose phosphotransferase [Pontibacter cellulosilyticus]
MTGFYNKYIKLIHSAGDFIALTVSLFVAMAITAKSTNISYPHPTISSLFLLVSIWFLCTLLLKFYKYYRVARTKTILLDALKAVLLYVVLLEAILNLTQITKFNRDFLIYHYLAFGVLVLTWRIIVTYTIRYLRSKGYNSKKVIIIGYSKIGVELKTFFNSHPEYAYKFEGFFDDKVNNTDIIGRLKDIQNFVLENEINEIYCSPFTLEKEQIISLIDFSDNNLVRVKFLPEPFSFTYQKLKLDYGDMLPFLVTRSIPLDDVINKMIKRTFDILFSLFVIVFLLSWLLPILAIIIKLDSKGPVFFAQQRSGINCKAFACWKLRSMYVNEQANSQFAKRNDKRITPVGAFLRKTSLDELPQFFNVLMGHMSIVGPRPHMLEADKEYALIAEKYKVRHYIKPGVTGLSQVRGYRGDTTQNFQVRGRIKLDIFYLENWSFVLDLKIIYYTIYNIFRGDKHAF